MQINIKANAKQYLATKMNANNYLFLATDDGGSKFSKLGGTCAIGNKFQIVVSDSPDGEYRLPLNNNAGYQLFISDGETDYLGNGLSLDYKNAGLVLADDSGLLDGAVNIVPVAEVTLGEGAQRTANMNELGGRIC